MGYLCKEGDLIHLRTKMGMFKVKSVHKQGFFVWNHKTHDQIIPWEEYKCHKGQGESTAQKQLKLDTRIAQEQLQRVQAKIRKLSAQLSGL